MIRALRSVRTARSADPFEDGPTAEDLAAIEAEMPLIEAETLLVDAEIRVLTAPRGPSELDWRRLRRAAHRVAVEAAAFYGRPVTNPHPSTVVA